MGSVWARSSSCASVSTSTAVPASRLDKLACCEGMVISMLPLPDSGESICTPVP